VPADCKVLAVTGSNGKTTVTALTGELCRAAGLATVVAGNIGDAALDALADVELSGQRPDVVVLELSSFQLETTSSLVPHAATVLNVTENHLDRYPDMDAYAAAKARIFRRRGRPGAEPRRSAVARDARPGRIVETFGAGVPMLEDEWGLVSHGGGTWLARGGQLLLPPRTWRWSAGTTR